MASKLSSSDALSKLSRYEERLERSLHREFECLKDLQSHRQLEDSIEAVAESVIETPMTEDTAQDTGTGMSALPPAQEGAIGGDEK